MAEVSHIRNAANRTRPLGEVKDDIAYMVEQDSRYTSSRDDYNDETGDVQKMKDVKDSIRHAALINIVAAVNESCDDESARSRFLEQSQRSAETNMALLSNLVFHKDRSISIPKPQVFFEPPKTLSTKKPVFYKNSKDEVLEDIEERKRCVSLTRTRMLVDDEPGKPMTDRPKSEGIQFSVSIQQLKDDTKSDPPTPPWMQKPMKVKNARSMSPRRRFVSLNKKIETKSGTPISKCEAVDIMDATECLQNRFKPPPVSHIESYGEQMDSSENDLSIFRARSLPSLFPVKKKKEVKVTDKNGNGSDKDKAKLIAPFKRPSATAYGCLPNMVMGKTIQTKSENNDQFNLIQDQKLYNRVEKVSSAIKETISKFETQESSQKAEEVVISLEGHSIPNPRNPTLPSSSRPPEKRLLNRPQTGPDYMKMNSVQERRILRDLDHHFNELHRTLSHRSNLLSDNTSQTSQATAYDIANYGLVGKKFKSKNSDKLSSEKNRYLQQKLGVKPKSTKRVTFAPVENFNDSEARNTTNSICDERQDSSRTKRAINQANVKTGSSSMKAVSSGELSRLKKRIIPDQLNPDPKPNYDLMDNIRISGMSSRESSGVPPRPPSRMSEVRSMVSEGVTSSYFDEVAFDWNDRETDAADRASSNVPKSYGASSFYPDSTKIKLNFNHFQYSDSEESSEEEEDNETYRIVKAVDLGTLSGFQHRKFRKPPTKLETSTTHFVKIKVK